MKTLIITLLFFATLATALETNSTNYGTQIVTEYGGTNTSSSQYATDLIMGEISGNTSGTLYQTSIGFFYSSEELIVPSITLLFPAFDSRYYPTNVTFSYIASDDFGIANCTLNIYFSNGTSIASITNTSAITNNTVYYENYNLPSENSNYLWNVSCADIENTTNASNTFALFISTGTGSVGGGGFGFPILPNVTNITNASLITGQITGQKGFDIMQTISQNKEVCFSGIMVMVGIAFVMLYMEDRMRSERIRKKISEEKKEASRVT